jgi:hypothetical protein
MLMSSGSSQTDAAPITPKGEGGKGKARKSVAVHHR